MTTLVTSGTVPVRSLAPALTLLVLVLILPSLVRTVAVVAAAPAVLVVVLMLIQIHSVTPLLLLVQALLIQLVGQARAGMA